MRIRVRCEVMPMPGLRLDGIRARLAAREARFVIRDPKS
jgi:hypothetical protein